MKLTNEQIDGLNIALNEAIISGIDYFKKNSSVEIYFYGIMANKEKNVPENTEALIKLETVSRIAASFINPFANTKQTPIKLDITELNDAVRKFGSFAIYDNNFINCSEENFDKWEKTLSLDYKDQSIKTRNTITLAHIVGDRTIYIKIWFNDIKFYCPPKKEISLDEFIVNGKKAWDEINKKNSKFTKKFNIHPID